jgi:lysine biosynthesis protein LysW
MVYRKDFIDGEITATEVFYMMLECPICDATINVKNPQEGDIVTCKECDTEFELVQFDDEWDLLEVGEEDWKEEDDT